MVTEIEKTAPYGPATNVLQLLRRAREKGLPIKLTVKEMERVGITDDGTARKVLRTLRFLKLIDEDGNQLPLFDTFQRANSDEYTSVLAAILRDAYTDVFKIIGDPAQASDLDIDNAFRRYDPQSQRGRMVLLFQSLLREAQLREGGPTERRPRRQRSSDSGLVMKPAPRRTSASSPASAQSPTEDHASSSTADFMNSVWPQPKPVAPQPPAQPKEDEGYTSLMGGLIHQLPRDHRWTKSRRDMWLKAIEINVDWLVMIVEEDTSTTEE